MLIEFRVANYRSFKEEQTLSMVAGDKDTLHPENITACDKYNLLKTAAIYGPNASGKSNLIKAMRFMLWFIGNSATRMTQGDAIKDIVPFLLSEEQRTQPSTFEFMIKVDDTKYQYGFSATKERVVGEWLTVYPPHCRRPQRWLERDLSADGKPKWSIRSPMKKSEAKLLMERTRDNGLAFSRGAELNIQPLSKLFTWMQKNLRIADDTDNLRRLAKETAVLAKTYPGFERLIVLILRQADLGIDGLKIAQQDLSQLIPADETQPPTSPRRKALSSMACGLTKLLTSLKGDAKILKVKTLHKTSRGTNEIEMDLLADESKGTARLFTLIGPILLALYSGSVIVIDEIERSMHTKMTRKLIELFQNPEVNRNGAQLIFATHDTKLMESELFRRDQIWIVEKNKEGASVLYSLYDFKERPRNTEAFERNYLAGRYGGIPNFGPIFDDLGIK